MRCSAARTSGRWRSVSAGRASARSPAACGTGAAAASVACSAPGAWPVSTARLLRVWARLVSSAGIWALRLLAGGHGLLHVERGDQAGLSAPARDLQGLVLAGQVAAGNCQARLQAAQLDVGHRHLGGQRHLHVWPGWRWRPGHRPRRRSRALRCRRRCRVPSWRPGRPGSCCWRHCRPWCCAGRDAEAPTLGSSAATCASRWARAWRKAACALRTSVLACSACSTECRELRVVEALPPLRQRRRGLALALDGRCRTGNGKPGGRHRGEGRRGVRRRERGATAQRH